MYGFISGITDNDNIKYCPKCGEEVTVFFMGTERQSAKIAIICLELLNVKIKED